MQSKKTDLSAKKRVFARCVIDPMYQTVSTEHRSIRLGEKLFSILCCLIDNHDQVVTRRQLIEECWNNNDSTKEATLTHSICLLRKMFKQLDISVEITTLPKQGYVVDLKHSLSFINLKSA